MLANNEIVPALTLLRISTSYEVWPVRKEMIRLLKKMHFPADFTQYVRRMSDVPPKDLVVALKTFFELGHLEMCPAAYLDCCFRYCLNKNDPVWANIYYDVPLWPRFLDMVMSSIKASFIVLANTTHSSFCTGPKITDKNSCHQMLCRWRNDQSDSTFKHDGVWVDPQPALWEFDQLLDRLCPNCAEIGLSEFEKNVWGPLPRMQDLGREWSDLEWFRH